MKDTKTPSETIQKEKEKPKKDESEEVTKYIQKKNVPITKIKEINEEKKDTSKENSEMSHEIKLRAYENVLNKITERYGDESIFKKLIEFSSDIVQEFMENIEIPLKITIKNNYKSQTDLSKFIGDSATYIKKGTPNFSKVAERPHRYGFRFVVYHLNCKLKEFFQLPYIGEAKKFDERLSWHIRDAVRGYIDNHMTYIQEAIASAIIKELPAIKQEIEKLGPGIGYKKFNMIDIQNFLANKPSATLRVFYKFLKEKVLKKHFDMEIWEYHKERRGAFANEKLYTLNYVHYIGHKKVFGTIYPNGLNSKAGGSGGTIQARTDIPIFDYAALVSLGYKHEEIIQILNEEYEGDFPSSTVSSHISRKFGSHEELQERLLKPVVEELIKDPNDFQLFAIANAVRMDAKTLGLKLADWFEGNMFFDLKALIKAGILDWDNISDYSAESAKILRGKSIKQWKDWLVDDKLTMDKLANNVGVTKFYLYKRDYVKRLSMILIEEELESLSLLKKILRKKITKELLQQGWDPREIFEKKFQIQFRAPFKMRAFFENLFKDEGLSFEELLNAYSYNADNYINKYRYYSKDF